MVAVALGLAAIVLWRYITDQIAARVAMEERSILFKGAMVGALGCIGAEIVSNMLFPKETHHHHPNMMMQAQRMAELFQQFQQHQQSQRN